MVVEIVIGVNECADDTEGVERVAGEAVAEADLGLAASERVGPFGTCGCVEYDVDLVFKSGSLGKVIENVLDVVGSESLLIVINGRTVNEGDVLGCVIAVLVGIVCELFDGCSDLLFCKSGVVAGESLVCLVQLKVLEVAGGPLAVLALSEAVSTEDALFCLLGVAVLTAVFKGRSVFNIVVVSNVYKTEGQIFSTMSLLLSERLNACLNSGIARMPLLLPLSLRTLRLL